MKYIEKLSPRLQGEMRSSHTDIDSKLKLIVSLRNDADWGEGVRLLQEAGLEIESMLKEIRAISGTAKRADVQTIADILAVELIEMDESVSTMASDSLSFIRS